MTKEADEKFIDAFYEKLMANPDTRAIAKDFKNLQTPADSELATIIDSDFELKSTGHYITQTAKAIDVDHAAEMITNCSTDKCSAPELAKRWVSEEFDRKFMELCSEEITRLKTTSQDKRNPKALKRKIQAYNNLVSPTKRHLSLSLLKEQALVAANMHTSRLPFGKPKSYNKMKDFFSDQKTAVDLIEKLESAAPTLDTKTKSTDQPRPAAFSVASSHASTATYDSESDRDSPKPK